MTGRVGARGAAVLAAVLALSGAACVGTTGGELLEFTAAAAGPVDADSPFAFTTYRGWHVVLEQATLHVGAIYLDQSQPVSGSQGTNCILPGTYVAQVTSGLDVNLLSSEPTRFSTRGQGTTIPPALVGQVWLTGGDINAATDPTPILVIAGTAEDASGHVIPFEGTITIDALATTGEAAGQDPVCKERIVSVPTTVSVETSGGLLLRIDPRLLFVNVDFSQLTPSGDSYAFSSDPSADQPSYNLNANLRSSGTLFTFSWDADL
jgi:hypothetical protein